MHSSLSSKLIEIQSNKIEHVYVLITISSKLKFILGVCYILLSSNIDLYIEHTNTIKWLLVNADINTN